MAKADRRTARRRGVDPVALVAGLLVLLVASVTLNGDVGSWIANSRWLLAGAAVLIGVLAFGFSLRSNKKTNRR